MSNSKQSGPPPVCDLQNIALYDNGPKAQVCLSCFRVCSQQGKSLKVKPNVFTPRALRRQCTGLKTPAPQQIHTFSARRDAMFLQNVVFVPESQIYHNSTGAFLSGSVYGMRQKRLLGSKLMFSLFLWWRDFKITYSSPERGFHLLCQRGHGN